MTKKITIPENYKKTFEDIKNRIRTAQYDALKAVNKEMISLYWDIGGMIAKQQEENAWGKSVVETLSKDLQKEFPGISGFSVQNLWYMRQLFLAYNGHEKLQPLVGEISWSKHIIIIGRCKEDQEREFYIRMTAKYGWSKNVLAIKIQDKTYETTTIWESSNVRHCADRTAREVDLCGPWTEDHTR